MTGPHPPAFDFQPLLAEVTRDFADAIRDADLSSPVAACPGWQVRDLVGPGPTVGTPLEMVVEHVGRERRNLAVEGRRQ